MVVVMMVVVTVTAVSRRHHDYAGPIPAHPVMMVMVVVMIDVELRELDVLVR
jgi:hypothetical protein